MKVKLLSLILIFTVSICYSQMSDVLITLKNGEILKGVGKMKAYTFKYKADANTKAKELEFSTIKSVEIDTYYDDKVTYHFFQVEGSIGFIAVEELVSGNKAELYGKPVTFNSHGMGMNMGMGMQSNTSYYIKKPDEDKLTEF